MNLRDRQGAARIIARLNRFETTGHAGDVEPVGEDVMEMRFHFGPGYRVYYIVLEQTVYLLGGNKSTQVRDIRTAKEFANYWKGRSR